MGLLQIALLFITGIWLLIYIIKSCQKAKKFPPGPPRLPIWGSYWFMLKENYQMTHLAFIKLAEKYKTDLLGVYLGDFPCVVAMNYELSKEVLNREEFIGRAESQLLRERSMGEMKGIFFTEGDLWKGQRRFSLRHMRDYGFGRRSQVMEDFVNEEMRNLIDLFASEPTANTREICRAKGEVLLPEALYGPITNSIMLVLSSTRYEERVMRKIGIASMRFVQSIDATGSAISFTPWLRFIAPGFFGYTSAIKSNNDLLHFTKEVVDDHIATFSKDHLRDFIDDFINENWMQNGPDWSKMDYKQLVMTVLDFMFAPPIAIGQTILYFVSFMIDYPHIQQRIQEEIDNVIGRSRLPTLDDRKNLPYTEATVREVLRIIPLNPIGVVRRCTKETTLAGYVIPENCLVAACLWSAHRDPKVWDDPEVFNPERFLDEDGNLLKRDLTLTFGNGKRLCAGETFARQTMVLMITGILQNYTLELCNGKKVDILNNLHPGFLLSTDSTWIRAVQR